MAESDNKTEKPTGKRLSEAQNKGQFARTAEIQTVFILTAGFVALLLTGESILRIFTTSMVETFGQLGKLTVSPNSVMLYFTSFMQWLGLCVSPVMGAAVVAAVLAGGLQSRFHLSWERMEVKWDRLNPVQNIQHVFSPMPSLVRTLVGVMKLLVILGLTSLVIKRLLEHPIFYTATGFGEILFFMADSVQSIATRVLIGLTIIAAVDYAYQFYKHQKGLMMSKQEVKEEHKASEGSPEAKGELRKRRVQLLRQNWMRELPKADVIVTNPTHLAIALRYDRKTMRAPRIVAKGARLNALRIREIAQAYQIPIVENKPVARLLFKHCKVGQEIPADVYTAVAEILAYVYRVNRFKYHMQGQQIAS